MTSSTFDRHLPWLAVGLLGTGAWTAHEVGGDGRVAAAE